MLEEKDPIIALYGRSNLYSLKRTLDEGGAMLMGKTHPETAAGQVVSSQTFSTGKIRHRADRLLKRSAARGRV